MRTEEVRAAWRLGSTPCHDRYPDCELCGGTGTTVGPVPTGDAPSWIANPAAAEVAS